MLDYERGVELWTDLLVRTLHDMEDIFRGDQDKQGHLVIHHKQEAPPLPRGLVMTALPLLAQKQNPPRGEKPESAKPPGAAKGGTSGRAGSEPRTRKSTVTYVLENGRFIQFLFMSEGFYLDLPNTTLVEHEPAIIFAEREGFYRDDPASADCIASPEDIRDFEPIDKRYHWDDIPQAAEDAAWLLFDLYNLDVTVTLDAQATYDDEDHRWTLDLPTGT